MDAEPTTPRAGVAREGDTGPDVNPWGPNLVHEFHPRAAATAQGHLRLILYLVLIFVFFYNSRHIYILLSSPNRYLTVLYS